MTDQQAKDLQQTLDFISGQLHGLAILRILEVPFAIRVTP